MAFDFESNINISNDLDLLIALRRKVMEESRCPYTVIGKSFPNSASDGVQY